HAPTAGRHEGLLVDSEHGCETVAAEAGVLAGAAIIKDRDLDPVIGVATVGHALGVLGTPEAEGGVGAVAKRFDGGSPASAPGTPGPLRNATAEPVPEGRGVGDQVRPVGGGFDPAVEAGLQAAEFGEPGCRLFRFRLLDREVLEGGDGLRELRW